MSNVSDCIEAHLMSAISLLAPRLRRDSRHSWHSPNWVMFRSHTDGHNAELEAVLRSKACSVSRAASRISRSFCGLNYVKPQDAEA